MRYTLTQPQEIHTRFQTVDEIVDGKPAYNISPKGVETFIYRKYGENHLYSGLYGFVSWQSKRGRECWYAARAEDVLKRPTFQNAFIERRCLVPADGFFVIDEEKQPYYVRLKNRELFAFAGIIGVDRNYKPAPVSFAILSIYPNTVIASIQSRMPVIIRREDETTYLDPDTLPTVARDLCQPYDEDALEIYPVTKRAAFTRQNSPDFVLSLEELMAKNIQRGKQNSGQMTAFGGNSSTY